MARCTPCRQSHSWTKRTLAPRAPGAISAVNVASAGSETADVGGGALSGEGGAVDQETGSVGDDPRLDAHAIRPVSELGRGRDEERGEAGVGFVLGIGLHLVVAVTMYQLIYFSLQMISLYLVFVDPARLRRLAARLS